MSSQRRLHRALFFAAAISLAVQAAGITIVIDYTYDAPAQGGSAFFGNGNPQGGNAGTLAKAALNAAASFYSTILNDTFSLIQTPLEYHSKQFDGEATWEWTMSFTHPSTNNALEITGATVPANQYIIYAGARSLPGSTAGIGGPGGYGWSYNPSGGFTSQEIAEMDAITDAFEDAVVRRGEPSGFARWGGAIAFDNDGTTPWFFNHLGAPSGNVTDFYSVALHEMAHTLGIGASSEWTSLVSGSTFIGADAKAQNGNVAVPLAPGSGHWVEGKTSFVYGGTAGQETLMDPSFTNGARKVLTALDAAAFKDLGWELVAGDYDSNGRVDAADYVLWRNMNGQVISPNGAVADGSANGHIGNEDFTFWRNRFNGTFAGAGAFGGAGFAVPEPASVLLMIGSGVVVLCARRKRRG